MAGPDYDPGGVAAAALEEAMRAIAERDGHEARAALYRCLLDAWLLVLTPTTTEEPSAAVFRFSGQLRLVTVAHAGGTVIPAFTSVERVGEWLPAGGRYVALPAQRQAGASLAAIVRCVSSDGRDTGPGYEALKELQRQGDQP
jgi:hypothetical protein